MESAVPRSSGWRRERLWGLIVGFLGSAIGAGAFALAYLIQGEPVSNLVGSPYPAIFTRRAVMPLDYFFAAVGILGFVFVVAAALISRWGRYPRSDGFAAALTGAILSVVAGAALCLRLWAVLH
jgi:hypothetical protein